MRTFWSGSLETYKKGVGNIVRFEVGYGSKVSMMCGVRIID
jgi:hypothetical protein